MQTAVRVVESPSPLLVIVSLLSEGLDGQDRAYPPVVKVLARCVRLWLTDSHVLWARFRHRLSHCSHGLRESCHRCVHRSARRLLTNLDHLCSELIELTSQHLTFLRCSATCKSGKQHKTCSNALCKMDDAYKGSTSIFLCFQNDLSLLITLANCQARNFSRFSHFSVHRWFHVRNFHRMRHRNKFVIPSCSDLTN